METKSLRELVSTAVEQRWEDWAKEHPHLASAVDRVRLVETVLAEARTDPAVRQALLHAGRDGGALTAAAEVVGWVERAVGTVLGG